jgi:transcriptional regulator with XRE-family HTH domain
LVPSALETDGANMNSTARLTGRLVAAARALTGISQSELAIGSGISLEMLRLLESSGAAWVPDDESQALGRALETFGVVTIPEGDGMGAGVRLKFTRQDSQTDRSAGKRGRKRAVR